VGNVTNGVKAEMYKDSGRGNNFCAERGFEKPLDFEKGFEDWLAANCKPLIDKNK
jgi:hypothetical protein